MSAHTLIVEDDPLSGRTLAAILRHFGHEVELVTSVQDGLASLASEPRHVLLDLMLPDGDGALILARIHAARQQTRVAIVSSFVDEERIAVLLRLGAQRFFSKPVNPDELISWLQGDAPIHAEIQPESFYPHNPPGR
ncbi:hypothetical protein BH09PLA1_BH09PLA1_05610 [soil metagenome]